LAHRIPTRLTPAEGRKFALTVGTAFWALAGLTWWRDHGVVAAALGSLGAVLWVAGLVIPGRLRPVYAAWMGLAHAISRVTTPIFMGVVFFGVIMPVGLVMRALGRNPVRHRPVEGSFWMARTEARGTLRNQF
jgi:Saxitoxin biosynthesis operon protein SxtJ